MYCIVYACFWTGLSKTSSECCDAILHRWCVYFSASRIDSSSTPVRRSDLVDDARCGVYVYSGLFRVCFRWVCVRLMGWLFMVGGLLGWPVVG